MCKALLLASLIAPALATAQPAAKKAPVLIEETHAGLGLDVGPAGFQIFTDGTFHYYVHDPKAMHVVDRTGALTDKEFADVKTALAKAPWKVTHNEVTCDALAVGHTIWAAGKRTFDEVLCGNDSIDTDTQKAFRIVGTLEAKYSK